MFYTGRYIYTAPLDQCDTFLYTAILPTTTPDSSVYDVDGNARTELAALRSDLAWLLDQHADRGAIRWTVDIPAAGCAA